MNRKESIARYRNGGGKVVAVYPGRYPRAACEAAGFLPVEVWDPPGSLSDAGAHLPAFVCSIAQRGLGYFLDDKLDADALLFPHICDSLQNLFSIVRDYLPGEREVLMFYPPRNTDTEGVEEYLAGQIEELSSRLARLNGREEPDGDAIGVAVAGQVSAARALRDLYLRRSAGALSCSNREFYDVVRSGEYLPSGEFAAQVADFLSQATVGTFRPAVRKIVLSGVLPQKEIIDALDKAGCLIVDDDLISAGRRVHREIPELPDDPWQTLARLLLTLPPCSTVGSSLASRGDFLEHQVRSTGARGVLFHTVKFCEPELFDHPVLVDRLNRAGVATQVLESELYPSSTGALVTRLEAFMEMLS